MSNFQIAYALVGIISLILGVIFIFIDGMLLYAIGFFSLFLIMGLMKIMWGIAGWADNVARKMGED